MYNIRIINSTIQLVNVIIYQLHICASIALIICILCLLFIDLMYDHQVQHHTYLYSAVIKKSRF